MFPSHSVPSSQLSMKWISTVDNIMGGVWIASAGCMTDVPAPCLTMVHQSPVVTFQLNCDAAWRMAELRPDLIQTLRESFRLHNFHIPPSQASSDPLTLFTRASNVGSRRFHNHGEGLGSKIITDGRLQESMLTKPVPYDLCAWNLRKPPFEAHRGHYFINSVLDD